ncbi:MAG: hypothetical protein U0P45_04540 [Acidimicrobiales bacterium]
MAAPTPAPRAPISHGIVPSEWPAQAADTIVETIGKVRDRTTKPAIIAARSLVYGLSGAIMALVSVIILLVGITHAWSNYLPVWILYAIYTVLFTGGGLWCLSKAKETKPDSPPAA